MPAKKIELLLSENPNATIEVNLKCEQLTQGSIEYLTSPNAKVSISENCYWPKWNSPWWHLATLFEMGQITRVPKTVINEMVKSVKNQLPIFFSSEIPPGIDPSLATPCHCSLGNIYQILFAAGVDVDRELPWARKWFFQYQMPDGGFNCDERAYHANPPASSMVGTIAPLEAVLNCTPRTFSTEEIKFLDRGAQCLIERELRLGCSSKHNLEEKEDESDWMRLCFPRFYFYDVLRGLHFILNWSFHRKQSLPSHVIYEVASSIAQKFPDGIIHNERLSYEGVGTRAKNSEGKWQRGYTASLFPLLKQVSEVNSPSPYLTHNWNKSKDLMKSLIQAGLIT